MEITRAKAELVPFSEYGENSVFSLFKDTPVF